MKNKFEERKANFSKMENMILKKTDSKFLHLNQWEIDENQEKRKTRIEVKNVKRVVYVFYEKRKVVNRYSLGKGRGTLGGGTLSNCRVYTRIPARGRLGRWLSVPMYKGMRDRGGR